LPMLGSFVVYMDGVWHQDNCPYYSCKEILK
jgi:hypothetical protein